ncbi:MAG: DUF928 domain-containing protein [Gloeotrichia echinulata GP01]
MTHNKWLLYKLLNVTMITICVLSFSLSETQIALGGYQPPRDQKSPSGYSDSSGVRGGCKATGRERLRLLAPLTHVGQTTSPRPTLAWLAPHDQTLLIEFSLYEFDINLKPKKLNIYTRRLTTTPGIMKLSLPQNLPGLKVGKRYLWQLQTLCDTHRPSRNPFTRAEIEVVHTPQTLLIALSRTQEPSQKAHFYAEAGIWYDALNEVLPPTPNRQLLRIFTSLLTDLAKFEQP